MTNSKKRCIIFDLDGTVIDSELGIVRCISHAFEALELPVPSVDRIRSTLGPPFYETFPALGIPTALVDRAIDHYRERYVAVGMYESSLYDGISEVLQSLSERGWISIIATSKPEMFAQQVLDHFEIDQYFSFVAGATLHQARNSKIDIVRYAMENMPVDASTSYIVGDREVDLSAGVACGLRPIAAAWGYGSPKEFQDVPVHAIANSPTELLTLLP